MKLFSTMKNVLLKFSLPILLAFCVHWSNAQLPLEYLYTNQLGGLNEEIILDLETDSQENVYVLLDTESEELYSNDSIVGIGSSAFLLKYNSAGDLIYCYEFKVQEDDGYLYLFNIELMESDDVILTGALKGTFQFGDTTIFSEEMQGFICKIYADGSPGPFKLFDIAEHYAFTRDFRIDDNNDIYVAGGSLDTMYFDQNNDTIIAPSGTFKMPVWKFDSDFNLQWLKVFYTDGSIVGRHPISIDEDNNIIIACNLEGYDLYCGNQTFQFQNERHILFSKITSSGEIIWIKTADGFFNTINYDLCCDADNNIYFTSRYYSTVTYDTVSITPVGDGACETFVFALNINGDLLWYNQIRNTTTWPVNVLPNEIKIKDNEIYLAGEYQYDVYFGDIYLSEISGNTYFFDSYITKIDKETGTFLWAQGLYGDNLGSSYRLPFDFGQGNNIFLSAQFTGQATYDTIVLQSYGDKDVFVAKLNEVFVGIEETENEISIKIFPNPGNDKLFIQTSCKGLKLQLYNRNGQVVLEKQLQDTFTQTINTSSLPVGLYIYKLTDKEGFTENGKWIKN